MDQTKIKQNFSYKKYKLTDFMFIFIYLVSTFYLVSLEYHKRDYYSRFSHNNQIPSVLRGAKLGLSSNISTKEKYHIVTEIMTQIGS